MSLKKADKQVNYLELVPEKNCREEKAEDGRTSLMVPRFKNSLMKKFALKMGRSEFFKIRLDNLGSRVWELIDGNRTVGQIGEVIEKQEDPPLKQLYDRLTEFLSALARNKFISFKNY